MEKSMEVSLKVELLNLKSRVTKLKKIQSAYFMANM